MSKTKNYSVAGKTIRGFEENGQIWFIGQDIARAIGTSVLNKQWNLEEHEQGFTIVETKGGPQRVKTVSTSGLVSLIFRSRTREANGFRQWAQSLITAHLRPHITEVVVSRLGVDPQDEREARRTALKFLRSGGRSKKQRYGRG